MLCCLIFLKKDLWSSIEICIIIAIMVLKCTDFCGKYSIHCPVFLFSSPPAAILHFICFSYLLSAFLPLCDLVLPPPQDFLPLLRWQGDGLSPNKLVHLSIRASVEEVPAIMKLSGRLRLREWWREGEKTELWHFVQGTEKENRNA